MTAPVLALPCLINLSSVKTSKDRVLIGGFGRGYRQITPDGMNSYVEHWNMSYRQLSGTDLTTVETFLDIVGVIHWFTWTPTGESVTKKWRIDLNSIRPTFISTTSRSIAFSITQQFDYGV